MDQLSCEGPRTPLKVTIVAASVSNAGSDQIKSTETTATLTGTGSAVGTWTFVTGPNTPVINPAGASATANVSSLTSVGSYIFKYTVVGAAPCTNTTSNVTVSISTTTDINLAYLNANISIYPNPVMDRLVVNTSNVDGYKSVKLIDMMGKIVYVHENASLENIDMSSLSKGLYVVQIDSEFGKFSKTIVKQ